MVVFSLILRSWLGCHCGPGSLFHCDVYMKFSHLLIGVSLILVFILAVMVLLYICTIAISAVHGQCNF